MLPRNLHITEVLRLSATFSFPLKCIVAKKIRILVMLFQAEWFFRTGILLPFNLMLLNSTPLRTNAISILRIEDAASCGFSGHSCYAHYLWVLGNSKQAVVQNVSLRCYTCSGVWLLTLQKASYAEMRKSFGCWLKSMYSVFGMEGRFSLILKFYQ